ncbi:MAG: 4-hydroxythreonine-4-phosphate dehydrogenase PdxA [Candidatus Omnitrophica bacterium]|nr:4-hydroxythreonine-4-phosphate dehydrogenase PdxA [Candidatus Omnitrophota bacterium]
MAKLNQKIKVGVTMGDPSGIGPEIIIKALAGLKNFAEVTVIGDARVFNKVMGYKSKVSSVKFIDLKNVKSDHFAFGKVKAEYGRAAIEYLDRGLELIKRKEIDCLVTCPISKEAINLAGFKYSGHTEYFSQKTKAKFTVMMLLNQYLKFSLATRHIPLKKVSTELKSHNLEKVILLTDRALKDFFGIKQPRIVICGLNPHASDHGIIGKEENRVIKPVVGKLGGKKHLSGPMSADAAILKAKQGKFDCVIAIYHDQALIPLKLLDASSGVNLTLGLPFIRTSPLHGTAFDIAGKNQACPDSLIAAIKLSVKCASNLKND